MVIMIATLTNVKNNELFNAEDKVKFLEDMVNSKVISVQTARSYYRIFGIIFDNEDELGRDINTFNFEEMEKVMIDFKAKNRNTVESYARIISSYLNWSMREGKGIGYNVLADLRPDDFKAYMANQESYFTEDELLTYEEQCENAQDAIILRLLFNGFGGREMSELRNLKRSDVDVKNNIVHLVETLKTDEQGNIIEFTDRREPVDKYTMELIVSAMNEDTYMKKNGKAEQTSDGRVRPYTDLVKNDYVIRASITKSDEKNIPVDKFVIHRRLKMLKNHFGIDSLTAKYIQRSGMIHYANQIIQDDEITINNLKMVAKRFNIPSYHNLKGIVTIENIRETYPK